MSGAAAIRPAEAADAEAVAAIYAPIVATTAISFEIEPPDAAEMRRRIETTQPSTPWLVCAQGPTLLGYAYAGAHRARAAYRWSVDVSAYVHESARRRGVASALYAALLELLALQGYQRAYAGITLPNAASVALHERAGFEAVGVYRGVGYKLGTWHDVGWWGRPLGASPDVPDEPRAFVALRGEPAAAQALRRASAAIG